jgi:hypothetical protein
VPILQKAMELKKKKDLELFKGNPVAVLHTDYLNQYAVDVDVILGNYEVEATEVINNFVNNEIECFDRFVEQNPEVLLPCNLDLDLVGDENKTENEQCVEHIPDRSFKDPSPNLTWSDEVKKGKGKNRGSKESFAKKKR